jgi:hypothetical protein
VGWAFEQGGGCWLGQQIALQLGDATSAFFTAQQLMMLFSWQVDNGFAPSGWACQSSRKECATKAH